MRRQDFTFELPAELIAREPPRVRGDSRLLCLDGATGECRDRHFSQLAECLRSGDLLVFNNTRVIPARLYGHKASGGRVEILLERLTSARAGRVQLRASKSPKPGSRILLEDGVTELEVTGRADALYEVRAADDLLGIFERLGHTPLPPYMERPDTAADRERYQTVYAQVPGAVAAPTAGLHFTEAQLAALAEAGVRQAYVTLHVGAGTFTPLREEEIERHTMHSEWMTLPAATATAVAETRAAGGRVVAVGTTAVRCLESAAASGEIQACEGETAIYIYPGYRFRAVDALITNFHLPESTLLLLVSAFAGREHVLAAYRHAVSAGYRFYSYGDAMWITPAPEARYAV